MSDSLLRRCLVSVGAALRPGDQIIVVLDGPSAKGHAQLVRTLSPDVEMVIHDDCVGLVDAWNECLTRSRGNLIHIVHCDDAIVPEFYEEVRRTFLEHPEIVALATASRKTWPSIAAPMGARRQVARVLRGSALAQFLLSPAKPSTGSFVYSRAAVGRAGLFLSEFKYCPDEEFCLRLAGQGPMAFLPLPMYIDQTHPQQYRYETWRREDFVEVYASARLGGAAQFNLTTRQRAEIQTARNVLSVVEWLVRDGDAAAARHQLAHLRRLIPRTSRWLRFWVVSFTAYAPGGRHLIRATVSLTGVARRFVHVARGAD